MAWRIRVLIVVLVGCMVPGLATAQPASGCAACVSAAGCDTKRDNCVAECRARLFTIDPRRADCITKCSNEAALCSRTADGACRTRNLCR
jgi:hypothetical protein